MLLGADVYETEDEMAALLASGKVPLGIGENAKLRNCIIDKNARIGKDVTICNTDVSTLLFHTKRVFFCDVEIHFINLQYPIVFKVTT